LRVSLRHPWVSAISNLLNCDFSRVSAISILLMRFF
jgi:hypothetical protein